MRIHDTAKTAAISGPTLNLNGSGVSDLIEQYREALDAVLAAEKALAKATPHGRDYQIGPVKYQDARDAHVARARKLSEVYDELHALAIDLLDQQAARER